MLESRGYIRAAASETAVESLPEAPGIYVLMARGTGGRRVLGVWMVRDPWLRTDVAARLAKPEIAAEAPDALAYRVMDLEPGDGVLRHQARLMKEQVDVVEALQRLA